jgi:hypothetical protein
MSRTRRKGPVVAAPRKPKCRLLKAKNLSGIYGPRTPQWQAFETASPSSVEVEGWEQSWSTTKETPEPGNSANILKSLKPLLYLTVYFYSRTW